MIIAKRAFASPACFLFCCLFGVSGVMLFITSAFAQDTVKKSQQEPHTKGRFGFRFSKSGSDDNRKIATIYPRNNITSPEDDIMPYPFSFFSIRYDTYEINIAWADDDLNENIFRFTMRYNYYATKNIYTYGGFVFWRWNKKFHHINQVCDEYGHPKSAGGYSCKEGKSRSVEIKTDRPDGKYVIPGVTFGSGIEYTFIGLVLSHEVEFYIAPCSYDNFICSGHDLKFLGIHFIF